MRRIGPILAAFVLAVLASSPAAIAKQYAPPGKAGTSEYAEDIPTAGGNVKTPAMGGGNKTAAEIDRLGSGKEGVRRLAKLGKAGAEAALFTQQTAPATRSVAPLRTGGQFKPRRQRPGTARQHPGTATQATLTATGGSAISALRNVIGGSDVDGLGILLPLLLAFLLGAAVAVGVSRVWRGRQPQA
ncbi:MAG TPA: hypothetical protein VHU61_06200 [Solirubrobacteraceae bacterium]|jgi:hypothetical protein|nr:hypothetical protein [Solirubrobacteraceae bacterium]